MPLLLWLPLLLVVQLILLEGAAVTVALAAACAAALAAAVASPAASNFSIPLNASSLGDSIDDRKYGALSVVQAQLLPRSYAVLRS